VILIRWYFYLLILYRRSPLSSRVLSIFIVLPMVEMAPRTECACHLAVRMISPRVAPFFLLISAMMSAFLLSLRGAAAAFFAAGFLAAAFLPGFLGLWHLFRLAGGLLRLGGLRRNVRALWAGVGGWCGGVGVRHGGDPFSGVMPRTT
jgi:hypothetical protein